MQSHAHYHQLIAHALSGISQDLGERAIALDARVTVFGSGSFEDADPFQIIAMEEEIQASIVHKQRFGKRESFSDKTTKTLAKCIIPALYMSRFTCFLAYRCMLFFWNHCLICTPKITVTVSSTISFGNRFP